MESSSRELGRLVVLAFARVVGVATLASMAIVLCAVLFGCSGANFDIAPEVQDLGLGHDSESGDGHDSGTGDETSQSGEDTADTGELILDGGPVDTKLDTGTSTDTGAPTDTGSAADTTPQSDTCHVDNDGDGYLSMVCSGGLDCDDKDQNAHFGQASFFSVASKGAATFDYNCNGVVEKEVTTMAACVYDPSTMKCNVTQGWVNVEPECGKTGDWLLYATHMGTATACYFTTEPRVMKCR